MAYCSCARQSAAVGVANKQGSIIVGWQSDTDGKKNKLNNRGAGVLLFLIKLIESLIILLMDNNIIMKLSFQPQLLNNIKKRYATCT